MKKTQLYYSVHKRFPNEAIEELEKLYLAVVQITVQRRDQLKISFLAVHFPLLSIKVQLNFFHTHFIYFLLKKANKQKSGSSFLFGQGKSSLKMFFYLKNSLCKWAYIFGKCFPCVQYCMLQFNQNGIVKKIQFSALSAAFSFFFSWICSVRKTQRLCFEYFHA